MGSARRPPDQRIRRWWEQWKKLAPAGLAHQNPLALLRLLQLVNIPDGTGDRAGRPSALAVEAASKARNGRLDQGLRSRPRRRRRITITPQGRQVLEAFLSKAPTPAKNPRIRGALRRPTLQRGQLGFDLRTK